MTPAECGTFSSDRAEPLAIAQSSNENAGATFRESGFRLSSLLEYGSGLRTGPNNDQHVPDHVRLDVGAGYEFGMLPMKPALAVDIVNLFDTIYAIRDGGGIGVFAPQFGPRRGYFAGISKKF